MPEDPPVPSIPVASAPDAPAALASDAKARKEAGAFSRKDYEKMELQDSYELRKAFRNAMVKSAPYVVGAGLFVGLFLAVGALVVAGRYVCGIWDDQDKIKDLLVQSSTHVFAGLLGFLGHMWTGKKNGS